MNQIQYNTLDSFGYLSGQSRTIQTAALPIIFSIFLLIYFLFWRFNDSIWNNDKEFLLLLTLILVASVFLRGTSYFSQTLELDYLKYGVPISFVGVVSATLLNLRASLVLSLSSALLALAGGGNIGLLALGGILSILPSVFISEDNKDENNDQVTQASLDADYNVDEFNLDEQLSDTESSSL